MNTENTPPNVRKRNLKVYYGHYDFDGIKAHPMIRLKGKYLAKFGFNVGDIITVAVDVGQIIIKKVAETPPS